MNALVVVCQAIAPNVFSLNDEGFAEVIKDKIPEELTADVMDALENCPTNAIEEAMKIIKRIKVNNTY